MLLFNATGDRDTAALLKLLLVSWGQLRRQAFGRGTMPRQKVGLEPLSGGSVGFNWGTGWA